MSKPETGLHQFVLDGKPKQLRHMDNSELMRVIEWLVADRERKKVEIESLLKDAQRKPSIFEQVFGP
jgi:hypothetical protein